MDLLERLHIGPDQLEDLNSLLLDPTIEAMSEFLDVVARYGTPEEINRKAQEAGEFENLMSRLKAIDSPYVEDIEWLIEQRDRGAFVTVEDYRRKVLGDQVEGMTFKDDSAVTLEISAAQYFPYLRVEAEKAIDEAELMPSRFIRVRNMAEAEKDQGDLLAFSAAMQVMGASFVETPDTRGTDGSNVHLGDPLETITGYYGGVGQPNDRALKWVDEILYYYTNYGISEVLNINAGTVFLGYMLYKLGIDIRFKISVMLGNDSPYTGLWTLLGAKLFEREDGTSPLIGLNWSCAANNETLRSASQLRNKLGFEDVVRFEHHIVQCRWGTVVQPYDRREELMELAATVPNISAKHEGGDVEAEAALLAEGKHASNVLDYFREKAEILEAGDWDALLNNYIEKHNAVNHTARELTKHGLSFIAAPKLHQRVGK